MEAEGPAEAFCSHTAGSYDNLDQGSDGKGSDSEYIFKIESTGLPMY